jgi:hypothetical protein
MAPDMSVSSNDQHKLTCDPAAFRESCGPFRYVLIHQYTFSASGSWSSESTSQCTYAIMSVIMDNLGERERAC